MSNVGKFLTIAVIIGAIALYLMAGMSNPHAGMRPCPICGKETSSTLVAEQGCCNDCYDRAERTNQAYEQSRRNGSKYEDQYDYYFREDREQSERDDYYERQHERDY